MFVLVLYEIMEITRSSNIDMHTHTLTRIYMHIHTNIHDAHTHLFLFAGSSSLCSAKTLPRECRQIEKTRGFVQARHLEQRYLLGKGLFMTLLHLFSKEP